MPTSKNTNRNRSVTEGQTALELFTNRDNAIRLFAEYVHQDPPRDDILFFHGAGGNGKTLLLKFLRDRIRHRLPPDDWNWVRQQDPDLFLDSLENTENGNAVPFSYLDFESDEARITLPALLKMRRDLRPFGLDFPLFDFACLTYWQKTDQLSSDRLKSTFPNEEADLVVGILEALGKGVPGVLLVKELLAVTHKHVTGKRFDEWFTVYLQRRGLTDEDVREGHAT